MDHADRLQELPQFLRVNDPGDVAIASTSLRDQGIDPIMDLDVRTNSIRQRLGDICFVERRNEAGKLLDLFLVPEWPEDVRADEERALHFYAILLNGAKGGRLFILRPWAPGSGYRKLSWDDGMSLLGTMDLDTLPEAEKALVERLMQIDETSKRLRFNADEDELRRQVGPRRGGRLYLNHLRYPGASGLG